MFLPVFTSQSIGGFFSWHTAFRRGVRAHMGQSAASAVVATPRAIATEATPAINQPMRLDFRSRMILMLMSQSLCCKLLRAVGGHDDVVVIDFQVIGEAPEPGCTVGVWRGVFHLDRPRLGLGLSLLPDFALHDRLAVLLLDH